MLKNFYFCICHIYNLLRCCFNVFVCQFSPRISYNAILCSPITYVQNLGRFSSSFPCQFSLQTQSLGLGKKQEFKDVPEGCGNQLRWVKERSSIGSENHPLFIQNHETKKDLGPEITTPSSF
ncbi:hypothetical protein VNO77_29931 [Canavalia gladiata]|uniref:Uncharacterized protein n=1 Tax=Canavalia gladiata TaxID=3824 RepID=A0AAN9Q426_CANGL